MVLVAVKTVLHAKLMISPLRFPTELHREVAELAGDFFSAHASVDTILVVNSCARGRAVTGSDLDLAVLMMPTEASQEVQSLTTLWQEFIATQPLIHRFRSTGRFTQVHVDVFDGRMVPTVWDDGGGPDSFEVEIGNRLAYAAPLHEAGAYFRQLRSQWLPYYGEDLRASRLAMVREECAGIWTPSFSTLTGACTSRPLIAYTRRSRNSCRRSLWRDALTHSPTISGFTSRWRTGWDYRSCMRSFRQFFPFGTLEVLNWARRWLRCVRFWSAGPAPNLTAMRRPNLTLHRMAAPPRRLVIRESQRAAIGELTVRRLQLCTR